MTVIIVVEAQISGQGPTRLSRILRTARTRLQKSQSNTIDPNVQQNFCPFQEGWDKSPIVVGALEIRIKMQQQNTKALAASEYRFGIPTRIQDLISSGKPIIYED